MFLSCEFVVFCPSNYPVIMLPGVDCLNDKWCPKCLAPRPTFSGGLKKKEREREKYEAMINADKSNYVEQTLKTTAIMLHDTCIIP